MAQRQVHNAWWLSRTSTAHIQIIVSILIHETFKCVTFINIFQTLGSAAFPTFM